MFRLNRKAERRSLNLANFSNFSLLFLRIRRNDHVNDDHNDNEHNHKHVTRSSLRDASDQGLFIASESGWAL
jgi:hypothetical protein